MKKRTLLKSFFLMVFLVTIFIFAAAQSAVSEMTLNDNVNIEGDIFLNGTGGGINFPDGSEQRTAARPPWSKIITTNRFEVVLGGEAVLDHETGLVWEMATSEKLDWNAAHAYCYRLELGGRMGWRLPTIDELTTLVDNSQVSPPKLPPDNHFIDPVAFYYWSSTTYAETAITAWVVYFADGGVFTADRTDLNCVRAVRSGQ